MTMVRCININGDDIYIEIPWVIHRIQLQHKDIISLTFLNPRSLEISRKVRRLTFKPYLRMRPRWLPVTRLGYRLEIAIWSVLHDAKRGLAIVAKNEHTRHDDLYHMGSYLLFAKLGGAIIS